MPCRHTESRRRCLGCAGGAGVGNFGLVDELLVYLAPKLIGEGLGLAHMAPLADLSQAYALEFNSVERVGEDLRILARLRGRDCF